MAGPPGGTPVALHFNVLALRLKEDLVAAAGTAVNTAVDTGAAVDTAP